MSQATATPIQTKTERRESLAETLVLTKVELNWCLGTRFLKTGGVEFYTPDQTAFTSEFIGIVDSLPGCRATDDTATFGTFYAALIALYQFKNLDEITEEDETEPTDDRQNGFGKADFLGGRW